MLWSKATRLLYNKKTGSYDSEEAWLNLHSVILLTRQEEGTGPVPVTPKTSVFFTPTESVLVSEPPEELLAAARVVGPDEK